MRELPLLIGSLQERRVACSAWKGQTTTKEEVMRFEMHFEPHNLRTPR